MTKQIAGISVPDSRLAREATEQVRDCESQLLFDHSLRVYFFGSLRGRQRGWVFDSELLYLGAMFHDVGLTEKYRSLHDRFEVDGANAAREFLGRHEIAESAIDLVWDAIALHTTPDIPWHKRLKVALVTAGVEMDVLGLGFAEVSEDSPKTVAAHFGILTLLTRRCRRTLKSAASIYCAPSTMSWTSPQGRGDWYASFDYDPKVRAARG